VTAAGLVTAHGFERTLVIATAESAAGIPDPADNASRSHLPPVQLTTPKA